MRRKSRRPALFKRYSRKGYFKGLVSSKGHELPLHHFSRRADRHACRRNRAGKWICSVPNQGARGRGLRRRYKCRTDNGRGQRDNRHYSRSLQFRRWIYDCRELSRSSSKRIRNAYIRRKNHPARAPRRSDAGHAPRSYQENPHVKR